MQNRYVGDIRDFAKYGLLRWLCGETGPPTERLSLGVVWYLVAPKEVDAEGDHGGGLDNYLWDEGFEALRACDPPLVEQLRQIREPGRDCTVADVEEHPVLPGDTRFFSEQWSFEEVSTPRRSAERRHRCAIIRCGLVEAALDEMRDRSVVFLDPDNGIFTGERQSVPATSKSLKHVLPCEAKAFSENGGRERSLVVIQFPNYQIVWKRGYRDQAADRLSDLRRGIGASRQVMTLTFAHAAVSSPVVFFVAPCSGHVDAICERARLLLGSPWGEFFTRW